MTAGTPRITFHGRNHYLKKNQSELLQWYILIVSNHLQAGLAHGRKTADEGVDDVPGMRLSSYMEMQTWKIDEEENESLFPTEEYALKQSMVQTVSYSPEDENINKISPALVAAEQYFRSTTVMGRKSPVREKSESIFPMIGKTNQ